MPGGDRQRSRFTGTPTRLDRRHHGTITADVTPGSTYSTEAALPGWDLTSVDVR